MTDSTAYDDISGNGAPTRIQIARRIRKAREFLNLAEERLGQGEINMARHWLNRACCESAPRDGED